jgi:hypothetical protein
MFQPKLSRTLAAAALTVLTLLPLSGLQAAPLRPRQLGEGREARTAERFEQREVSLWRLLLSVVEKLGARIDENGSKAGASFSDVGPGIDDNG